MAFADEVIKILMNARSAEPVDGYIVRIFPQKERVIIFKDEVYPEYIEVRIPQADPEDLKRFYEEKGFEVSLALDD